MRLKLFKKYFFTTAAIIIFSLAAMMMILSFMLNDYMATTKQQTLDKACVQVGDYILELSRADTPERGAHLFSMIRSMSDVSDADVFIADSRGEVLVCSCEEWRTEKICQHSQRAISKEFLGKSIEDGKVHLGKLDIYENAHYYSSYAVFGEEGYNIATVFAASSVKTVHNFLGAVTKLYVMSAVVPIIIMFFAIYIMTYRMTKPLKLMSEASRAMAKGDFSKRIPVMTDDEIGELSASFNMMTNSLSQLEGMRKSFVANVSHELKTPMTSIGGFIDGILDGTIEPDKQEYYLNIVSDEVKRLSRLVQSMLNMSRLESGEFALKPELFDLREMVFNIVISQEKIIEQRKIQIIGLDELQSVSVNADKDLIHQAIYNLVDNAVKFTPEGGNISFSLNFENRSAVLMITNTGVGIPQKDIPFIFERFYKVDKSRSAVKNSTGIGLYIVKTVVNAHSGNVAVASREGEWTTFRVTLPTT